MMYDVDIVRCRCWDAEAEPLNSCTKLNDYLMNLGWPSCRYIYIPTSEARSRPSYTLFVSNNNCVRWN